MHEFDTFVERRPDIIDGVGDWMWLSGDTGAWDGPKNDWPSHKAAYEAHLTNRRVCIQAGGCQGMYPRLLSEMFEVVYTFEPDPHNFFCLVNNCQKTNIIKMQAALGDVPSLIRMDALDPTNKGMHQVAGRGAIPQFTIDQFNFPVVDAIFLDVERYEPNVIEGARRTIMQHRPLIALELGDHQELEYQMIQLNYVRVAQSKMDTIYKPC